MGDVFGKPAIVTDTHCIRLVKPYGAGGGLGKDPKKVEMALWKLIPPEEGSDFSVTGSYSTAEMSVQPERSHSVKKCRLKDTAPATGYREGGFRENGMNVKDLKSFEAVCEGRGINQAAQKLFITPQGLSRTY